MSLSLLNPPVGEPASLDALKAHLRVTDNAEDALIAGLGLAARQVVEARAGLAILEQTWRYETTPRWDAGAGCATVDLPLAPFVSVSEVATLGADGLSEVLPNDAYEAHAGPTPRIVFNRTQYADQPVAIVFTVDWPDAGAVPENLTLAIKQLTAHWFVHREAEGTSTESVSALIAPWRRVRL